MTRSVIKGYATWHGHACGWHGMWWHADRWRGATMDADMAPHCSATCHIFIGPRVSFFLYWEMYCFSLLYHVSLFLHHRGHCKNVTEGNANSSQNPQPIHHKFCQITYYCCIIHSLYSTSTCCSISHLIFLVFFQSNMETLKAATVADGEAPISSAQAVSSELDLRWVNYVWWT